MTSYIRSPLLASSLVGLLTGVLWATPAQANCARPVGYTASVAGNTVTIRPVNFAARGCPDTAGMVRQNVATGEAVALAAFCDDPTSADVLPAYIDECVPPGHYRYGFATPYTCLPSACSTSHYAEATVTQALAGDCVRSDGNAAPTAADINWTEDATICTYQGTTPTQPPVEEPTTEPTTEPETGCSLAAQRGANALVLALNALALLIGAVLIRRRRHEP